MQLLRLFAILAITAFACKKTSPSVSPGTQTPVSNVPITTPDGSFWVTSGDRASLLSKSGFSFGGQPNSFETIEIDSSQRLQTIDGFGFTLTGGSAELLHQMSPNAQNELLKQLFAKDQTHISYLRISVGASDLSSEAYTYTDGLPDPSLLNFSLAKDEATFIPILKKILAINPDMQLMASPWSAPAWMKTNNSLIGGKLLPEMYSVYANYWVKYLKAMEAKGIKIHTLTIQNEPENPHNNPSMLMTDTEQAQFIAKHLGPLFAKENISTKIVIFDHNADHPQYPISVLNNPEANPYIDGSAFHLYAGEIDALNTVKQAHPNKKLYFTEQWTGANGSFGGDLMWHTRNVTIGSLRNHSSVALEWNLAANPNYEPHTNGGCTECKGALTISADAVTRNVSYYIIAHLSQFVPPGSIRIASSPSTRLPNVAFVTPTGQKVLVVLNDSPDTQMYNIAYKNKKANMQLQPRAVATIVW
jgi:glucosylceramidase